MNPMAWEILDKDEKMAITLQLGYDKSSWQSGEIMNKSHYKYLEIKDRAKRFLKLFTEHFELYLELIPDYIPGNKEIIAYFKLAMGQRMDVSNIHSVLDNQFGRSIKRSRNAMIIEQMNKWEKSGDAHQLSIYQLIKEFDRWNNFRILPKDIQEPSGFKRRNKNMHKRNIRLATSLPDIALKHIEKNFKGTKLSHVYLPIATVSGIRKVVMVTKTKEVISYLSTFGLYVFEDKVKAKDFMTLIVEFITKQNKSCKEGLEFWPKYREAIPAAYNHDEVQKISPTRKYHILSQENLKKPKELL